MTYDFDIHVSDLKQLVGNPNAYAIQQDDGGYLPQRESLTSAVLRAHLEGEITVGTYVNRLDEARTLVFDLDSGAESTEDVAQIDTALEQLEVPTWGIESSGRKGWHIWVVLENFVPAAQLRRLGRAVCAQAGVNCEVFPKQDEATDLGNLIKLPGGIHRVTGKRSEWLTVPPLPLTDEDFEALMETIPEVKARAAFSGTASEPHPCLARIQEGVAEGGRNNCLFQLAVMLRRNGVVDEYVYTIVHKVNDKCQPPVPDYEVAALLQSSRNAGPICGQLPASIHCGADCILERRGKLTARAGLIRHGAPGDAVVVKLGPTPSGVQGRKRVTLEHPDLFDAQGVLS